ncbi:MAG: response regulator [Pseudomonadota bacterium]
MKPIMIVDDSPTMLASIEAILAEKNHTVITADSGEMAAEKLGAGARPGLIITDLNMPGMDGIELIHAIRKMPRHRFTPIIMLTTESKDALRDQAKAAGASGWIVKPVDRDSLLQVVGQVLP